MLHDFRGNFIVLVVAKLRYGFDLISGGMQFHFKIIRPIFFCKIEDSTDELITLMPHVQILQLAICPDLGFNRVLLHLKVIGPIISCQCQNTFSDFNWD